MGHEPGRDPGQGGEKADDADHDKTHKVAASKENPEYIVESDKSGKRAAHKPSELRKRG